MLEWDKHSAGRWSNLNEMTFMLTDKYLHLLDSIDCFLLTNICIPKLIGLLQNAPTASILNTIETSLATGPSLVLLVVWALGFIVGFSPKLAFSYAADGRLFRPLSPQECTWNAM
jgi:hypothetical protein